MIADSHHLSGIPFLRSHLYCFGPCASHIVRELSRQANPRRSVAIEGISFCIACQHQVCILAFSTVTRTFVALGHRASAGTAGILGRFPEPGTSGRLHLGSHRMELDH